MKPKKHLHLALSFVVLLSMMLLAPCGLRAQGQVDWGNIFGSLASPVLFAPVYGVDPIDPFTARTGNTAAGAPPGTQIYGGPLLSGTGYSMSLFVGLPGTPSEMLQEVHTATFRTGIAAGFIFSRGVILPNIPPGTEIIAQCRAWNNQGGTFPTWESLPLGPAYGGASESLEVGVSDVFRVGPLGGVTPDGRIFFPPRTTDFRSFNLVIVPEPSTVALLVFGLGALCWRLRRDRD